MANLGHAQPQALPHFVPSAGPPPSQSTAGGLTVQLIETPVYSGPTQPTTADLLRAIQDLGSKIHQLSKNQQALETKLNNVAKKVDAINHNVVAGATWLSTWDYSLLMNMPSDGPYFPVKGLNTPHWK